MVNYRTERRHPDDPEAGHAQYQETLRQMFAAPIHASTDQILADTRPAIASALRNRHGANLANALRDEEETARRVEHGRGAGWRTLFTNIPFLTRRRPRKRETALVADVNKDMGMLFWMDQRNLQNQLDANPALTEALTNKLNPNLLLGLADNPELRFAVALLLQAEAANPGFAIGNNDSLLEETNAQEATRNETTARKAYESAKNDHDTLDKSDQVLSTAAELESVGDLWTTWNGIQTTRAPLIAGGALTDAQNRTLDRLRTEEQDLIAKKQAFQKRCRSVHNIVNTLDPRYFTPVPPTIAIYVGAITGALGAVDWSGTTQLSWDSIQTAIGWVNNNLEANLAPILAQLSDVVDQRKDAHETTQQALKEAKEGSKTKMDETALLHAIWTRLYQNQATPHGSTTPDLDEGTIRRKANMAVMMSLSEARDQTLLRDKMKIRCEELARKSGFFRRVFSRFNFSSSAQDILNRMRHVTVAKNTGDSKVESKPFARLKLNAKMSRAELRKSIQDGQLAPEDVPSLYLHLEAALHHYENKTLKPKDATYIIDMIHNLKVIRNETLHRELMSQYEIERIKRPTGDMLKFLKVKMEAERKWENQMASDILQGKFFGTISPKAIKRAEKEALVEVKAKMKTGEWGYRDAVSYLDDKGFDPGILRKTHFLGRKFANWFGRKNDDGSPGLARKTASTAWSATKKTTSFLTWPARKILGAGFGFLKGVLTVGTGIIGKPMVGLYRKIKGGEGVVSKVRKKYDNWWASESASPIAAGV